VEKAKLEERAQVCIAELILWEAKRGCEGPKDLMYQISAVYEERFHVSNRIVNTCLEMPNILECLTL
jgi:hypothetical protein